LAGHEGKLRNPVDSLAADVHRQGFGAAVGGIGDGDRALQTDPVSFAALVIL
jgi:hypothetical protein